MMSDFLDAVRVLSVLPLPGRKSPPDLRKAMFFFPLVGILLAGLSLAAVHVFSFILFSRLESLALVTAPILLTGGVSLTHFVHFCDGFFGAKTPEERIRKMEESRIGAWGIVGASLLLFWKWELLVVLPARSSALLLALTAARWAQVALAYFLPSLGKEEKVGLRGLVGATAFLAVVVVFLGGGGLLSFITLLPFLAGIGFLFLKRAGGVNEKLLGAASEATEFFVFLCLFWASGGGIR